MIKELIVGIGLLLVLFASMAVNAYFFRRIEVMHVMQDTLTEIIQNQDLEIKVLREACNHED